jgi:ATP-dependent RNA helicase DeaD
VVVESLSVEGDVMDIAAAAVKLAHIAGAGAGKEEADIPSAALPSGERRSGKPALSGGKTGKSMKRSGEVKMVQIYIGSGRKANMRPGDLVGAITNEAGIDGKSIGAIEVADRHSLVEIPEPLADQVIKALRATTIKGKRQTVRLDMAASRRKGS